jgi:hypothetical protein
MAAPDLVPIKSSMASHAHYDPQAQTLHVRFKNGDTWRYQDVPVDKAETLLGAASFGSSFNKLIAGRHGGTKL